MPGTVSLRPGLVPAILVMVATCAAAVPGQGITDGSFEASPANVAPAAPWVVTAGSAVVRATPDDLFPSDGAKYLILTPGNSGSGTFAEVRQSFTRPAGAFCGIFADWEFITGELPLFSADSMTIDVRNASNAVLATVLQVNSAFVGGTTVNVPAGGVSVPNQALLAPGTACPAPAGFKRAWTDLSAVTTTGVTYTLVIRVQNGTGMVNSAIPTGYVDNVVVAVADRNAGTASLRVLGSSHTDGRLTSSDMGGDLRPETPFYLRTCPGQRLSLRASGAPNACWVLATGTLAPVGTDVAGYGIVNLNLGLPISILLNGVTGTDLLSLAFGTISAGGTNFIELSVPLATPLGTRIAFEAAMCDPASASGFNKTATSEVSIGQPQIPLGSSILAGGANTDDGFTQVTFGAFTFSYYGTSETSVFVNSNGSLTFGAGSTDLSETETEMFTGFPRIAVLWDDLQPAGTTLNNVSVTQNATTLTVSWRNVPEFGSAVTGNNVAIQLYQNGVITLYYGSTTLTDGVVGITPGGLPAPAAGVISSEDWSDPALALGSSQMAGPGEQRFEQFGFFNLGPLLRDTFDVLTLGTPGPARITFQPTSSVFGLIDYRCFTGTR